MKSQPVTETQEDDDIVPSEAHGFVKKEIPDDASSKRHISKKKEASAKQVRTEAIDEQLSVIYENGDGTMPDMHHFERSRGRTMRAVVVLLFSCLFLGGVAYAGFFFFQPPAQFSEDDVVLTVSGNEQVQIGESVKYRIRYKNDQSTALTNATIHVRYPDGFVFKDSSIPSTNDSHDEWKIGALEKEASGYFDIEGNVYADQGSKQSLRVFLDYRPANFSSDFQKAATAVIEVAKSPYTLAIEGDKEAVVGAEAAFTITVAPTADMEASSSTVVVSIDSSVFTKKSSQPTKFGIVRNCQ